MAAAWTAWTISNRPAPTDEAGTSPGVPASFLPLGSAREPDDETGVRGGPLPAGTASDEVVETEMTELVAAVGGEYHIAERRGGEQSAQRFEPADEPAAALRGRLPPRAARRHDDDRPPPTAAAGNRD